MKFNFLKIIFVLLIINNFILGSPILNLMKTPSGLRTLHLLREINKPFLDKSNQRLQRNFVTGLEPAIINAAPALMAALPCVAVAGGVCYSLHMFYEVFGRPPTPEEIDQALIKSEADLAKLLWQKAQKQASKTGEAVDKIYDRLMFNAAHKKIAESEKAMQAWNQHVKEQKQSELELCRNKLIKSAASEKVSAKTTSVDSAKLSSAHNVHQSSRIQSPQQATHTGNTTPLVIPQDTGCSISPPPVLELSTGCGTTTPVASTPACQLPIPEQPKSTAICEFPAIVQTDSTYNENSLLNELTKGEKAHPVIKEILKNTIPGRETSGNTAQQIRVGGTHEEALEDFYKIGLSGVKDIPNGKMGYLPDGKTVNVRASSTYKTPTLEIYNPVNEQKVKIRYEK